MGERVARRFARRFARRLRVGYPDIPRNYRPLSVFARVGLRVGLRGGCASDRAVFSSRAGKCLTLDPSEPRSGSPRTSSTPRRPLAIVARPGTRRRRFADHPGPSPTLPEPLGRGQLNVERRIRWLLIFLLNCGGLRRRGRFRERSGSRSLQRIRIAAMLRWQSPPPSPMTFGMVERLTQRNYPAGGPWRRHDAGRGSAGGNHTDSRCSATRITSGERRLVLRGPLRLPLTWILRGLIER